MRKVLYTVVIILLAGVFLFSGWQLLGIWREYRAGENCYEALDQYISIPEIVETRPRPVQEEVTEGEGDPEQAPEEVPTDEPLWPDVDFRSLRRINEDVIGWLYIPGTDISYPVVQGEDNEWYLYRLITGEYNGAGTIFLEAGLPADFSAKNSPIYGHNMNNGTMFAGLAGYKTQEFYDAHPVAMLMTPQTNYLIHIYSGYVTDTWGDAWQTGFAEDTFVTWLENTRRRSYFDAPVEISEHARVVTFSTCTYEVDDARFVVHGILEEFPK